MGKAMRDNMAASKKADDITVSGEGGFDTPADMSKVARVGTPASVDRAPKAPSASVTKIPEIKNVGGGRSGGRGGPEAGEEAAYRAKLTPAIKIGTGSGRSSGRGGPEAGEEAAYRASRDTGDAMSRRMSATPADTSDAVSRRKNVEETATPAPVDETKLSANERTKRQIEKNLAGARSGSSATDTRSANERIREAIGMKKGGMTASRRGDGIAQRGKTRGKMY
jgi:hypothetical protein